MKKQIFIEDEIIQIRGAKKVVSSTANQGVVEMEGEMIVMSGSDMQVKKLNLEEGEVVFQGKVSQIKFSNSIEKKSILKRIFK